MEGALVQPLGEATRLECRSMVAERHRGIGRVIGAGDRARLHRLRRQAVPDRRGLVEDALAHADVLLDLTHAAIGPTA